MDESSRTSRKAVATAGKGHGFFAGMRFPKLFVCVLLLFLIDLVIPDFIPFIDELLLGGLTVMLGMLRAGRRTDRSESSKS